MDQETRGRKGLAAREGRTAADVQSGRCKQACDRVNVAGIFKAQRRRRPDPTSWRIARSNPSGGALPQGEKMQRAGKPRPFRPSRCLLSQNRIRNSARTNSSAR
jgi:hypothetical protein